MCVRFLLYVCFAANGYIFFHFPEGHIYKYNAESIHTRATSNMVNTDFDDSKVYCRGHVPVPNYSDERLPSNGPYILQNLGLKIRLFFKYPLVSASLRGFRGIELAFVIASQKAMVVSYLVIFSSFLINFIFCDTLQVLSRIMNSASLNFLIFSY